MTNAYRDGNNVPTIIAVDQTDGATVTRIYANPSTHAMKVVDGTTGTDYGPVNDPRDQNGVPILMAVSSADGVTPVPIYSDLDGNLLIKTT